jgi:hypothetical protein
LIAVAALLVGAAGVAYMVDADSSNQSQQFATWAPVAEQSDADLHRFYAGPTEQSIGDAYAEERVINLPEDGAQWRSLFVWPTSVDLASDPASQHLKQLFQSPRLKALADQTVPYNMDPSHPLWRSRYEPRMGNQYPQFWLIKPDPSGPTGGRAVFCTYGQDVLRWDARNLANHIAGAIAGVCPIHPQPSPSPQPGPGPVNPNVIPSVPPEDPDQTPDGEPTDDPKVWVWLLIFGGSAALAAFAAAKRD